MSPRLHVSDKVMVIPEYIDLFPTVPRLTSGRVYCVERVNFVHHNWWVRLVGVREHRYKCADDRGVSTLALKVIGRTGTQRKEAA